MKYVEKKLPTYSEGILWENVHLRFGYFLLLDPVETAQGFMTTIKKKKKIIEKIIFFIYLLPKSTCVEINTPATIINVLYSTEKGLTIWYYSPTAQAFRDQEFKDMGALWWAKIITWVYS